MSIRDPSHAGTWYSSHKKTLSAQLDGWLDAVTPPVTPIGSESASGTAIETLPIRGARAIIAPHAGYAYSGPATAWAYRAWDVTGVKRVFLLGPSHHLSLSKCAVTQCTTYATPLGDLRVDKSITDTLLQNPTLFKYMTQDADEAEHSLEMHLPYIYKIFSRTFTSEDDFPSLVPIMVGNTSPTTEQAVAAILAPYLSDPQNAFVISSDFAHWGTRFSYTHYLPSSTSTPIQLSYNSQSSIKRPIHESIKQADFECIDACETTSHQAWLKVLGDTHNTVCGRHPIGVMLAAMEMHEKARSEKEDDKAKDGFVFVKYEQSSECVDLRDSSVSYASAFAVL